MLLIDSVYIHESGGKVLLEYLLSSLRQRGLSFFLLADERLSSPVLDELPAGNYCKIKASETGRKFFYQKLDKNIKAVFCFANVPPPIRPVRAEVFILFHNTLILSGFFDKNASSIIQKFFLFLRRKYIWWKNKKQYTWIVQTGSMKERLAHAMHMSAGAVFVLPFFRDDLPAPVQRGATGPFSFLYVADGVQQKNHGSLLDAWSLLNFQHNLQPELHLTIPKRFTGLAEKVQVLIGKGCRIVNHKRVGKEPLEALYKQCEYLVFPSLAESFGLPLLEAVQAGCGVIAADLPYVYDVIEPSAVFDPLDAADIARVIAGIIQNDQFLAAQKKIQDRLSDLVTLLYRQS